MNYLYQLDLVFHLFLCFVSLDGVHGWMLVPSSVQERFRHRRQQQQQQRPQQQRESKRTESPPSFPHVVLCRRAGELLPTIDYQIDRGRGVDHLSADLEMGHVVVYQTGTWCVDGVPVGGRIGTRVEGIVSWTPSKWSGHTTVNTELYADSR